ncbi:hypothetical protein PIB30_046440 [Stylosanthes scabra]|uniref:Uncharacterized protein n=1 Tax=Stylosanthes scabra TaxID=79078 RepID=A0ABU6YEQ3_9FABA|nr:hypothetical protein [Stylosanthes scabra]
MRWQSRTTLATAIERRDGAELGDNSGVSIMVTNHHCVFLSVQESYYAMVGSDKLWWMATEQRCELLPLAVFLSWISLLLRLSLSHSSQRSLPSTMIADGGATATHLAGAAALPPPFFHLLLSLLCSSISVFS